MNNIREYAKSIKHDVVGKLTRRADLEYLETDCGKYHSGTKVYVDEIGNEYIVSLSGICIVTYDGGVI